MTNQPENQADTLFQNSPGIFQVLLEQSTDLLMMTDEQGIVRYISDRAKQITGRPADTYIGGNCTELIFPADRKWLLQELETLAGSPGEKIMHQHRLLHANESGVLVDTTIANLLQDNFVHALVWYFRKTGKTAENEEEPEDEKYKNLINGIGGIVWEANPVTFAFSFVSEQAANILGYSPEEWVSTPSFWQDHLHPDDRETALDFCVRHVREGKSHQLEYRMIAADGRTVWLRDIVSCVQTSGKLTKLRGVMVEINDLKKAETELNKNKELFEALALNSHDVIQMLDQTGHITYVSPSIKKILGYDPLEITGTHITGLIHPDDVNRATYPIFRQVKNGEEMPAIEIRLQNKKQEWVWVEMVAKNMLSSPVLRAYVVNYRDITEKKKVLEQLKESHTRYKMVSKATNEAIWEWNLETDKLYWGDGFERLFGYDINIYEPRMQTWEQDIHPDDLYEVKDSMMHHIRTGDRSVWTAEYRFRKVTGEYVYVMDRGYVLYRDDGTPHRMVGAMRDSSEQKRIEMERLAQRKKLERIVQQRTRELKELNKEMEAFNYSVSHDLRTPLRAMDIYLGLLDAELTGTENHPYVLQVNKCVGEMRNLIDDLLEFSKMGKAPLSKEWVEIRSIVEEIFTQQCAIENKPAAKLELGEMPDVYVDRKLLRIVLNNLLSNAIKYSSHREVPVIQVSGKKSDEDIVYSIRDNGIGFEQKFAKKLFKPFSRLHSAEAYKGTGAGLAIVDKIINRHNGEIWVEAVPDVGATFYIRLPVPQKQA